MGNDISKHTKQFVIQKHSKAGDTHWDFMLETEGVLATWRLEFPPETLPQICKAEKIFDHDTRFLTYEGPVNKGKGTVKIAENGTYEIVRKEENEMQIKMTGTILKEVFTLKKAGENIWHLIRQQ